VTRESVPLIVHYSYFRICVLFLSYFVFVFLVYCWTEGLYSRASFWLYILCVSLAVIRVEKSHSVLAVKDLSDLAHHAWKEDLVVIFLHYLPLIRPIRAGINWSLMAFSSGSNNHSCLVLFFGNGSIWSIILWWMPSMLLEDYLVRNLIATDGLF